MPNQLLNPFLYNTESSWNLIEEEAYMAAAMKKTWPKEDPSSSQTIDTLQIPEALLVSSLESIDLELAERASALAEISKLLEVVEETDSLIRHHISNLRKGASQSGKKKSKRTLFYPNPPVQELAGDSVPQSATPLPAGAGEWQFASAPSVQGQG